MEKNNIQLENQSNTGPEIKKFTPIIGDKEFFLKEEPVPMTQDEKDRKSNENIAKIEETKQEIQNKLSEADIQAGDKKFTSIPEDKEFLLKEEVQTKEKGIKGFFKNLFK